MVDSIAPPRKPLHTAIYEARVRSGLSQAQLAERARLDSAYISLLETGKRNKPSRDALLRLAWGLGLEPEDVDELLRAGGHPPLFSA